MPRRLRFLPLVLLLGGCTLDSQRALIDIRDHSAAMLSNGSMSVTVLAPGFRQILTGSELGGVDIPIPTSGSVTVTFDLEAAGVAAGTGAVAFPVERDRVIGVDITIDSINPALTCLDCEGSRSFPVAAALGRGVRDSIWVTWASNSISNSFIF